ncbi:MAG: sigma-70 family RNA polymerase sigma factor [Verrucomicrobia bacterium]|nr:sigma-70 family RNA polymerase sigma factor [Verrucomicrobiota bacterium]
MNDGHTTGNARVFGFHTTRWDLVLNSGNVDSPDFGKALAELCSIYWYPLYAFARYKGLSEHDAQDLTQSFFLHLLEKTSLKEVHPEKGRFRSFLLASFQNHISVYRQRACAAKRGGGCDVISLDAQPLHEWDRLEPTDDLTGETVFDAHWAKFLLERVTIRLAEEYRAAGKANVFERLRVYLGIGGSDDADSYEAAAHELGLSAGAVKIQVCRLRKRFATFLRYEVAQTVLDPDEIDAEIHALYEAIVATEGRLST